MNKQRTQEKNHEIDSLRAENKRLREAFSKFIKDVWENRFEADKLNIYCGNAKAALKEV